MANKAYKFRIYPTKDQEQLIRKTFGCVRFVYNKMLAERKETYEQFKDDKYHISILTEYEHKPIPKEIKAIVGLDFAMDSLYVESEQGEKANHPRFFRQTQKKLAKEQKVLSRRTKGSARYEKQRIKVAALHERVANQRRDFLHKKSCQLASRYDCVVIEDLNMKGMSQSLHFGKSVADNGWGMFTTFLHYKLLEQGKHLVKINKWFPSTKTCSNCGHVKNVALSERLYSCECGFVRDRDWNAAINIKNEGKLMLALP